MAGTSGDRQAGNAPSQLGRAPDQLRVLPGISPFIGSTQAEADRLEEEIDDLIQPAASLEQLKRMTVLDLSGQT